MANPERTTHIRLEPDESTVAITTDHLDRVSAPLLLTAFFLSGAAGLAYEVVWTRSLTLVFGVTTFAVATVLATFMGGLALGNYLGGRLADRCSNRLAVYAGLEAAIGLCALVMPDLVAGLRHPYVLLQRMGLPYQGVALGRALLAGLVLLPPTVAMGGTFPMLVRFLARRPDHVGAATARLYFANTAGAVAGCLFTGFVLIERFGLRSTTYIAAMTNFAVAAACVVLGWRSRCRYTPETEVDPLPPMARTRTVRVTLAVAALSGFASLGYEVLWTRALPRYVYNSTYAFTMMLATFLAGVALGSAAYAVLIRRVRRPQQAFALLEFLTGLTFVASAAAFADLLAVSAAVFGGTQVSSFGDALRGMFVRVALVLLLPATFLGATLPAAGQICGEEWGAGRAIGRLFAFNTFGAVLGSLATGFLFIPAFGMRSTLLLLIGMNFFCAAALHITDPSARRSRAGALAAILLAFGAAVWFLPPDLFRRSFAYGSPLVFYREGATDTVAVAQAGPIRVIVYDDQRGTAGTHTYFFNYFLGHLPLLVHPGTPRNVLHICFGVGNSLSAVIAHRSVAHVDNVELSPHVLEVADFFWTNRGVIHDPRVRTSIDDGRNFLMSTRETYDVITMEPPETFTAGVVNLYTREFYRDADAHLAANGVLLQWLPVGEVPAEQERRLFRAFVDVFPHATAWHQLDQSVLLLVGFKGPLAIDYQRLKERMREPRVASDLELIGIRGVDHLLSYFTLDPPTFRGVAGDAPPLVDDWTVLDFLAPRQLGFGFGFGQYGTLAQNVKVNGHGPLNVLADRSQYYRRLRVPLAPYLFNLDGEDAAIVQRRIDREAGTPYSPTVVLSEADWKRR